MQSPEKHGVNIAQQTNRPECLQSTDFYLENGLVVFTEAYHLRRGHCCGSGCRHCPYPPKTTPKRIVCLSAEAADWLWRIGAWEQVVGVTAFFEQPVETVSKPRVSGFSTANLREIELLNPDLVIAFSDVQAEFVAEVMRRGFTVLGTNQRTLAEVEAALALLARVVGCEIKAEPWLTEFRHRLAPVKLTKGRPRIYFEEWNEPLIAGIAWVSELIERAGAVDVFQELRSKSGAADRTIAPEAVRDRNPQVIFVSWCGRPMRMAEISSRPGWDNIEAVRNGRIYEIPAQDILQPGFRLVHGYERIKRLISEL
jgi:iron complex transport system substrate-binding protein